MEGSEMEAEHVVQTLKSGSIVYTLRPVHDTDGQRIPSETVGMVTDRDGHMIRVSFGDDVEAEVYMAALAEVNAPQGIPHGGLGDTLSELALRLLEERATLIEAAQSVCEMADNNDVMALDVTDIVQPLRDVLHGDRVSTKANGHQ
jgi:hypothetical protein